MQESKKQFQDIIKNKLNLFLRRLSYSVGETNNLTTLYQMLFNDRELEPVFRKKIRDEIEQLDRTGNRKKRNKDEENKKLKKKLKQELVKIIKKQYHVFFKKQIRQENVRAMEAITVIEVEKEQSLKGQTRKSEEDDFSRVSHERDHDTIQWRLKEEKEEKSQSIFKNEKNHTTPPVKKSKKNPDCGQSESESPKNEKSNKKEFLSETLLKKLQEFEKQYRKDYPLFLHQSKKKSLQVSSCDEKSQEFGNFVYGDEIAKIVDHHINYSKDEIILLIEWKRRTNGIVPRPTMTPLQDMMYYKPLQASYFISQLRKELSD